MKDKELLRIMQQNGWKLARIHGSHHVMQKDGQTEVIPIHGNDVPAGLLHKILKRTGLRPPITGGKP